jgi:hypothetical protein
MVGRAEGCPEFFPSLFQLFPSKTANLEKVVSVKMYCSVASYELIVSKNCHSRFGVFRSGVCEIGGSSPGGRARRQSLVPVAPPPPPRIIEPIKIPLLVQVRNFITSLRQQDPGIFVFLIDVISRTSLRWSDKCRQSRDGFARRKSARNRSY